MQQITTGLERAAKSYGPVRALDGVTLELHPGQVLGLLGPNGAGKTTAIKLLLGLLRPDSGRARLFGRDPRSRAARVRVGAMMQVGQVTATLRVRELIEQFSGYYPSPRPTDEVLELAGLRELQHRRSSRLSGGERQRLMFALAICGDPEMLFLDEPTAGMDVASRRTFWDGIRAFLGDGKTILLTTHYLEEADALADVIAVIDRGHVVAHGTPEAIKSRFTGKRIRCRTAVPTLIVQQMPGVQQVADLNGMVELLSSEPEQTLRELLAADATLEELEVTGVGLEEAFLRMTENRMPEEVSA